MSLFLHLRRSIQSGAVTSSKQPDNCDLSWSAITVNIIVFQVVIWFVQLNPIPRETKSWSSGLYVLMTKGIRKSPAARSGNLRPFLPVSEPAACTAQSVARFTGWRIVDTVSAESGSRLSVAAYCVHVTLSVLVSCVPQPVGTDRDEPYCSRCDSGNLQMVN